MGEVTPGPTRPFAQKPFTVAARHRDLYLQWMGRRALYVLAAGVLVAVLLLVRELWWGQPDTPGPRSAQPHPDPPARTQGTSQTTPGPGGPAWGGSDKVPEFRRLSHQPTLEEVDPGVMERKLWGGLQQRVMRAAAECYEDEPGRYERMEINYTLRFEGGEGSLEDVELESSEIGQPRLEQCVVDAVAAMTWRDRRAPNLVKKMSSSISILDMQKRRREADEGM